MATLATYPATMPRSPQRLGLRECPLAWPIGITVREYRPPLRSVPNGTSPRRPRGQRWDFGRLRHPSDLKLTRRLHSRSSKV